MCTQIGMFDLVVESFQTDFTGRLSLTVLGNQMLSCAGRHATRRGFGMKQLMTEGCTWVLSRLAIEMGQLPRSGEAYQVSTWIESVHRLQTYRCFAVADAQGQAIGFARSVWAMIDMNSRRPVDLEAFSHGVIDNWATQAHCPIAEPCRLRPIMADNPEAEVMAKYTDIDVNGHVNSMRYIDHVLDLFPLDVYRRAPIRRIDVAYLAETHHGDLMKFYRQPVGSGSYDVEIRKGGGETVCRARVTLSSE